MRENSEKKKRKTNVWQFILKFGHSRVVNTTMSKKQGVGSGCHRIKTITKVIVHKCVNASSWYANCGIHDEKSQR